MLKLIFNNILHYWRTSLAVLLGVVAGTAVISGALIVGDSVRDSLKQMTLKRLGEIDYVLHSPRFFREDLVTELAADASFQQAYENAAPALVLTGSLEHTTADQASTRRVAQVNVFGVDEERRLWEMTEHGTHEPPTAGEVVINRQVANQLNVQPNEDITLWIELPSSIPRDSLLGERETVSQEIVLTVKDVIENETGLARLNLNPSQQLPLSVFVSLDTLQQALDLAEVKRSRFQPVPKPARVNSIFVQAKNERNGDLKLAAQQATELTDLMHRHLSLEDLQLRVVKQSNYLSLESEQMILDTNSAESAIQAAEQVNATTAKTMVYLANELSNLDNPEKFSMYSIVAGLDLPQPRESFTQFQYDEKYPNRKPGKEDIVLNRWLAEDLQVEVGDKVKLKYHLVGSHGELPEEELVFTVWGIVIMQGPATDRGMTPELEGITDADTFGDWEQPFPMDLDRVTSRDEEYWEQHRAAPKAFLPLKNAQQIWRSRFGSLTSLRLAPAKDQSLEELEERFPQAFLKRYPVAQAGLAFLPIKAQHLAAASGATDFTGLFIGFSFFLILSSMILINLLFRLGLEQRMPQIGLLQSVGWRIGQVRRLFLGEGLFIVFVAGLLGTIAGVAYAALMVLGLTTWWRGAIGTQFLLLSLHTRSLIAGFVISIIVMLSAIWFALRGSQMLSIRDLLAGRISSEGLASQQITYRRPIVLGGISLLLILATTFDWIPDSEAFSGLSWQVVVFFLVGMQLLWCSLSLLRSWLNADSATAVSGKGLFSLVRLGLRNAARNRSRSVYTAGMIASAMFVITAVAAGRRDPAVETPVIDSGNGGFTLVAESSVPLLHDLNDTDDREELNLLAAAPAAESALGDLHVYPFRMKQGEDASCLNLYQTRLPTILGATNEMISRGGFKFANTPAEKPWHLLDEEQADGTIPVMGDMNTLMFNLKKTIGDTIPIPNAEKPTHQLKIVGMYEGSIFQGTLVMSEQNFHNVYPELSGYQYFLIEAPLHKTEQLSALLESGLAEYGFDTQRVVDRLANFLAVQNTYLSTFQSLGGLGLLLGTFGLATVMLRNVLERRSELALLRAVGFHTGSIGLLVLVENAFLLLWGLFAGTISALLAMAPHLSRVGAGIPFASLLTLQAAVFIVGMLAALFAVVSAVKTPIVSTLRGE